MPLKTAPDTKLRRAQRGIWEKAVSRWPCSSCKQELPVNMLGICEPCNFRDKLQSITVIAEPAALRQVRRQYGINGESDHADRERKAKLAYERGDE